MKKFKKTLLLFACLAIAITSIGNYRTTRFVKFDHHYDVIKPY